MKTYRIQVSVSIIEGDDSIYSPKKPVDFSVKEVLPQNTDAHKYLRSRIAEELTRNFSALAEPIDNRTDESKASDDPLEAPLPF